MRKVCLLTGVCLMVGTMALPASAQTTAYTAASLVTVCKDSYVELKTDDLVDSSGGIDMVKLDNAIGALEKKANAKGSCLSYIVGAMDAFLATTAHSKVAPDFCLPNFGVGGDEVVKVFLRYMDNHPSLLHETAVIPLLFSLMDAYACSAPK